MDYAPPIKEGDSPLYGEGGDVFKVYKQTLHKALSPLPSHAKAGDEISMIAPSAFCVGVNGQVYRNLIGGI